MNRRVLNLKCENTNLWEGKRVKRRWEYTRQFIDKYLNNTGSQTTHCITVLDIGGSDLEFGKKMAEEFNLKYYNTGGDLDIFGWEPINMDFDVIFCFEVLEHLMNPALFMRELKKRCHKNTQIFLSYPTNPLWLWGDRHFNEYTKNRFYTLISECGYEIEQYYWNRAFRDFITLFTGFRPVIRFCSRVLGLSRDNFYLLKLK